MKRKLFAVAAFAICLALLASGTLAYYTAEDMAHNVITSGAVDIAIEEWQETEEGLKPYPEGESIEVMPGTEVSKIVTVRNLEEESWIRARFVVTVLDGNKAVMELTPERLDEVIHIAVDTDEWLRKEGDPVWWYCAKPTGTDDATAALFSSVVFDKVNMTNEFQNCEVWIDVYAEAVQTANNGSSGLEAAGWTT